LSLLGQGLRPLVLPMSVDGLGPGLGEVPLGGRKVRLRLLDGGGLLKST